MTPQDIQCDKCGAVYGIGFSPWCRDGHGRVQPRGGFEPRFMMGLGQYVTGWGDVRKAMRQNNLDFRDYPSKGDKSARRDRIEQRKKSEQASWEDYYAVPPPATMSVDSPAAVLYSVNGKPLRRQIGF